MPPYYVFLQRGHGMDANDVAKGIALPSGEGIAGRVGRFFCFLLAISDYSALNMSSLISNVLHVGTQIFIPLFI